MRLFHTIAAAALALAGAGSARAALAPIDPASFNQTGATLTFGDSSTDGTVNPSYTLLPGLSASFGSYFNGQALTTDMYTGLSYLTGTAPAGPLTLASDAVNNAVITTDINNPDPSNEVLGGAAPDTLFGPLAVMFSTPVQEVAFVSGAFGEASDLLVEAFTADGASLDSVSNTDPGFQSFTLADSGNALIAGLSFYIPDGSLNSFEIDNLAVSVAALAPGPSPVPEPATFALFGVAALASGAAVRRRTISG